MKVSTKIIAGYAGLVLLMFGAVGYELILVQRMLAIGTEFSTTYFPAALTGIRLRQSLRDVEEFVSKYLLVGGEGYDNEFREKAVLFESVLEEMNDLARSEAEVGALERLHTTWQGFGAAVEDAQEAQQPGSYTFLPVRLEDQLRRMYSQVDVVYDAAEGAADRALSQSQEINESAMRVSWIAAATALLLSGAVVFPIVRSISGGLGRLTVGTRYLAEGRLTRRIREDRNDEFGELARSFNQMADRLEELDHLKKDFVSSVSHELKSPIASSRKIVQLLLDQVPGPLNPEQKRLLKLSIRSSRRLSSMVGTLLDLARMDAGTITYQMQSHDLGGLIRSTVEEFEVALQERGLDVVSTVGEKTLIVRCDRDRMTQVIGNVIDNAMKFAPRNSTIEVRVEVVGADRMAPIGGYLVSVADRGPGIPDQFKEAVFARFRQVRADGARHGKGGTGLGLAISLEILEAHDGKIWVDDNPGGGSIFRVLLPIPKNSTGEMENVEARPTAN